MPVQKLGIDFSFFFRTDQGRISAAQWRWGMLILVAPMAVLTLIWIALEPVATRTVQQTSGQVLLTIFAFTYLLFYSFAVILSLICFYNLTAKRLRARERPPSLAGLLPFGMLVTGAADWLRTRLPDEVSVYIPFSLGVMTVVIALWLFADCAIPADTEKQRDV